MVDLERNANQPLDIYHTVTGNGISTNGDRNEHRFVIEGAARPHAR